MKIKFTSLNHQKSFIVVWIGKEEISCDFGD